MEDKKIELKQEKPKKNVKKKMRKVSCFTAVFIAIFLLCVGSVGVLWAGGWLKDFTCNVVMEDSMIWDRVNCEQKNEQSEEEVTIDQGEVIDIEIPDEVQTTEELVTEVIEQASPGVVTVTVNTLEFDYEEGFVDQQDGIGSGFVVDSEGIILTNQHVVSELNADYSIIVPGEEEAIPVEKVYRDATNDIAVLEVEKDGLQALKLGNSDNLKRGNMAIAIGSPFGDLDGTATIGYITGLNRDVSAGTDFFGSVTHYEGVIQTDAAINPGNSGGPLLNSRGEVIGINFATTMGADNISFAIPINQVKARLAVFQSEGRFPQPYIGVTYRQRTVLLQDEVVTGAIIFEVEKNGPADKGEIKRGDIIVKVNDQDLSEYNLVTIIQSAEIGDTLEMEVWRKGEIKNLSVVVGDRGE